MKFLCLLLLLPFYGCDIVSGDSLKGVPIVVNMDFEGMLRPIVPQCKARQSEDDAQYTMVVYVDKDECPSCFVADLSEWEILMQECRRQSLPLRFVYIICAPSTRRDVFIATLSSSSISDMSYVDVRGRFAKRNPWITKDRRKHVFVFGKGGRPVFLSTPFDVEEIKRTCR